MKVTKIMADTAVNLRKHGWMDGWMDEQEGGEKEKKNEVKGRKEGEKWASPIVRAQ